MLHRLFSFLILFHASINIAAEKPNIIFILADDLGWTDLSVQGSPYYETPNIDRLAKSGIRFTQGYTANANCAPTRAALISGQYGPRTGVYTVGNINRFNWQSRPLRPVDNVTVLPQSVIPLPKTLKEAGYATGFFGKWHLGNTPQTHPSQRGYDEAIESSGKHFKFKTTPPVDVLEGTYLADFITDKAIEFIHKHRESPFFLSVHHFGVHSPYQAKPEWIEKFKKKTPTESHHDPVYASMIASVDESVGRILDTLESLNLSEKTLVIFTSDNGGVGGYQREGIYAKKDVTDNLPLRGGKGTFFEGGIRVPYIFAWKGTIPEDRISEVPIHSVDLYPTLLEIAKGTTPEGYPLDGKSYLCELLNLESTEKSSRDELASRDLFWHFPGYLGGSKTTWRTLPVSVIRSGDWKLIEHLEDGSFSLYNLGKDLSEQNNLASSHSDKVKELHQKLSDWRTKIGAKFPTKNPNYRP